MTQSGPAYSFEFFPPKTEEGISKLTATSQSLAAVHPRFFSVTFGAGGSTRDRTFDTVIDLQHHSGINTAPHLSCISSTRENIREMLTRYQQQGINHIVALRGDMPSGMVEAGEFRYANELITFWCINSAAMLPVTLSLPVMKAVCVFKSPWAIAACSSACSSAC